MRTLRSTWHVSLVAFVLAASGCGDVGPTTDAGVADSGSVPPAELVLPSGATLALPAPPAMPAPPSLEPCRAGWRAVPSTDGPTACDPWPASGQAVCPLGEAHFPGEPGCRSIGSACPAGEWPTDLPATGVLYVRAGAPAGGTGTRAAPFATIAAGVAAATAGTLVVAAPGTYDEAITLAEGVSLRGACAATTRVAYSMRDSAIATVRVVGADVSVSDLQIGGARSGLHVDVDGVAAVSGVLVDQVTETAVRVVGRATIRDLVTSRVITDPDDRVSAFGLVVESGGVATAGHIVVRDARPAGVIVDGAGSELTLEDVAVQDIPSSEGAGPPGLGAVAQRSGRLSVRGAVIERAPAGLGTATGDASVDAEDVVLRDIRLDTQGRGFAAVFAQRGTIRLRRALIERSIEGVRGRAGAVLELEDVVMRELAGDPAYPGVQDGWGVAAEGATLSAARLWIEHVGYAAVGFTEMATGTLSDLTVRDTNGGIIGDGGFGVAVQDGAVLEVSRALLAHTRTAAANAALPGSVLRLTDVAIVETEPQTSDRHFGRGVQAQAGATIELERVLVSGSHSAGLMVFESSSITASDLEVRDTRAGEAGALAGLGVGLSVQSGGSMTLRRVRIGGSTGFGVKAEQGALAISLEDLWIHDTERWGGDAIGGTTFGRGIDVWGTTATITRGIVERSGEIGILAVGGALTVSDLVVRDTRGDALSGEWGGALAAREGAVVMATDLLLERNREISLLASGDSRITASRVRIVPTLVTACATTSCPEEGAGIGVSAVSGGAIDLSDFTVSEAALCGVQVAGGELDLHRGRVEGSPIGANVQDVGYDIARLSDMVLFVDNERNLDSASLPVPEAPASFAAPEAP